MQPEQQPDPTPSQEPNPPQPEVIQPSAQAVPPQPSVIQPSSPPTPPQPITPPSNDFGASSTPVYPAATSVAAPAPAQSGKTNGLAIAGLIFAFIMPLIGLILSIISLGQIKKRGDKGKGLAITGIVISAISLLLGLFLVLTVLMAAPKLQEKARDVEAQSDINYLHSSLEAYYNMNGYYPASLQELQVSAQEALASSDGGSYQYEASPAGCTKCKSYTVSTKLEDGSTYSKRSLSE